MNIGRKLRIAVLMGGVSNERSISMKSGREVVQALAQRGHEVLAVDVTARNIDALDAIRPDVAFVALHGEFGEDGEVQQLLERKGIPYTGSGPQASRNGMDKLASKRAFISHSVPTPDYFVLQSASQIRESTLWADRLGYPVVCKPSKGGSSIGVRICRGRRDLLMVLACAFEQDGDFGPEDRPALIVERYAPGRELTVGILDETPLSLIEIRTPRPFFDYAAKYDAGDTIYVLDVAMPRSLYLNLQEIGLRAYAALGCRHMGRTDLILGNDGRPYVLEVNTIPGCTPRSLLPLAAAAQGIDFPQLCERLVHMALRDAGLMHADEYAAEPKRRLSA